MPERVEITGIAAGGAGVGRLADGRVTFVHRTAPGDDAEVTLVEEKRRWTRGRLVRLHGAGEGRRTAPCPHYDRCGGCTLEHLDYPTQIAAKARIVVDALARIGKLEIEPPPVVASPREFRYRNRVSFTLRRGRRGVVAGFHALEEPDELVSITSGCLLPEEPIGRVWGRLRESWGPEARRLPSGEELRLTLRSSEEGRVALAVDGGYAPGRPDELLSDVDGLDSIWHRRARAATFALLAGEPSLRERWADEELELGGDVFTQVNREAAALLEAHVLDRVRAAGPARVLDAYCGVGLYARALARDGVEVAGIEAHPEAVAEARRAVPEGRFVAGRVEEHLADVLPVDAAILNPPRAGLGEAVTARLREGGAARIVYVSCDPATLARDLARLEGAYRVTDVTCFDLFPQTAHVETVVELEECATT